jgi:hypothetical protein
VSFVCRIERGPVFFALHIEVGRSRRLSPPLIRLEPAIRYVLYRSES